MLSGRRGRAQRATLSRSRRPHGGGGRVGNGFSVSGARRFSAKLRLDIRLILPVTSLSSDETSRIHAPWTRSVPSFSSSSSLTTWAEISRPQIHGYPFTSAATLPPSQRFVSGADEKVVRVFEETEGFVASLDGLGAALGTAEERAKEPRRAVGASVPPLGLSNKSLLTDGWLPPIPVR